MNARYINPFVKAVANLFDTMIAQPVQLGKPQLKAQPVASHAISSVIQIQGQARMQRH